MHNLPYIIKTTIIFLLLGTILAQAQTKEFPVLAGHLLYTDYIEGKAKQCPGPRISCAKVLVGQIWTGLLGAIVCRTARPNLKHASARILTLGHKHPGAHHALLSARPAPSCISIAPEVVKAQHASNGASGVLSHDGARCVQMRTILLHVNHKRHAHRPVATVNSN